MLADFFLANYRFFFLHIIKGEAYTILTQKGKIANLALLELIIDKNVYGKRV